MVGGGKFRLATHRIILPDVEAPLRLVAGIEEDVTLEGLQIVFPEGHSALGCEGTVGRQVQHEVRSHFESVVLVGSQADKRQGSAILNISNYK